MSENPVQLSVSIVSHGHRSFVISLLRDLARLCRPDLEVILTWNIPEEPIDFSRQDLPFSLIVIANDAPKGFAANHNQAFQHASGANFVILNPDISLPQDPFPPLLEIIDRYGPCICAPLIKNPENELEDSARFFPSPFSLGKKALAKIFGFQLAEKKIRDDGEILNPDWIAGMFMLAPRQIYQQLNGLQECYHLYYEDVDFCARARYSGIEIYASKKVAAIHYAQRTSHRDLQFFRWHLASAAKFFISKAYIGIIIKNFRKDRHLRTKY